MQLGGAHQGGQRQGNTFQIVLQCHATLFYILERIPVFYAGIVPKNMRVAFNQLAAYPIAYLCKGEMPLFLLHLGVEHHLHQHVAQLLAHKRGVIQVDGIHRLVGFLQKVHPDGGMRLHLVPRAALFGVAQQGNDSG